MLKPDEACGAEKLKGEHAGPVSTQGVLALLRTKVREFFLCMRKTKRSSTCSDDASKKIRNDGPKIFTSQRLNPLLERRNVEKHVSQTLPTRRTRLITIDNPSFLLIKTQAHLEQQDLPPNLDRKPLLPKRQDIFSLVEIDQLQTLLR